MMIFEADHCSSDSSREGVGASCTRLDGQGWDTEISGSSTETSREIVG